jgi:hypothetical protein
LLQDFGLFSSVALMEQLFFLLFSASMLKAEVLMEKEKFCHEFVTKFLFMDMRIQMVLIVITILFVWGFFLSQVAV